MFREKNNKRKSLIDWLVEPPDKEPSTVFIGFMMNGFKFMTLILIYGFSLIIYHALLLAYKSGLFNGLIGAAKSLANYKDQESLVHPIIGLIVVSGYILYLFKKKQQFYYGFLETMFALGNCHILSHAIRKGLLENSYNPYLLLASGMPTLYLLVRGLSNMNDGWNKRFCLSNTLRKIVSTFLPFK